MTIPISTSCSKSKCLLDDLAAKCGCLYLSDLVYTVQDHCIKSALRAITPENYTMKEWIDAIEYLTRASQPPFVSQLEAAQYLFSIPFYYKNYTAKKF